MPRKPLSEETRKKISEAMKKRWQDSEHRNKVSNSMKEKWQDSEYANKVSNTIKEKWQDSEYREKNLKAIFNTLNKLEVKKKHYENLKNTCNSLDFKQKQSQRMKEIYQNPELRKKVSEATKKALSDPKTKKKRSDNALKMWQNSDFRKKHSIAVKKVLNSPDVKKKHSEAIKKAQLLLAEQHRQEFIEKYDLSKEFLEKEFVENNRFDIYKFCEYCSISYSFAMKLKQYFNIETLNIQRKCVIQQEIYDFISQYVQADFNNRKVINPQELDIYIPSKNIAIEFDGLLYHSSGYSSLSQCNSLEEYPTYHLEKTQACIEKGIQLFHIFENEWRDKKEIWQSVLLNAIGKSERVYARKCIIKEVSSKEAKEFLNANHLQGACNSKINLGLFYNNTLVSLMTFGKPRYNKQYEWELLRFCNNLNTSVIGGASKLLSYFIKNYKPKSILSYANLRWSTGNLYERLGFTLISQSSPNYFYFNEDFILHNRIEFQKHKLKDKLENYNPSLTESENMYNNGYRKIYDCGNLVYEMKLIF